jgi:hypothetical protein
MVRAKAYRKAYSEKDVQDAIEYLHAGHTKNIKLVANKFGIKYGTFVTATLVLILLLTSPKSLGNISLMQRKLPSVTGSNIEVRQCDHSVNRHFYRKSKRSSRRSHRQNGIGNFSNDILTFDWASHLVLTQSELNVSIGLPLMNTFGSLARLWTRRRSL